ncbi:MAG: 7TM diverse intracellular signaling domain-containing protein [Silvanigrellaceae bacterium]
MVINQTFIEESFKPDCVGFYFDSTGNRSADDLLANDLKDFTLSTEVPNRGYEKGVYWLHFKIRRSDRNVKVVYLNLGNPLARHAEAYRIQNNGQARLVNSIFLNSKNTERPLASRDLAVELPFEDHDVQQVLIKVNGVVQNYTVTVLNKMSFEFKVQRDILLFGMYYGIILIMALYNFWLFISLKDKTYLYYVGTILFLHGMVFGGYLGGLRILFSNNPELAMRYLPLSLSIGTMFGLLFSFSFLDSKKSHPRLTRFAKLSFFLALLNSLTPNIDLSPTSIAIRAIVHFAFFSLAVYVAVESAWKGSKVARIFVLSWGMLLISWTNFLVMQFGLIQPNFLSRPSLLISAVLELVLFSAALSYRIKNLEQQEKEKQKSIEKMSRYFSPAVAETLISNNQVTKGSEFDVTVLFVDIRGFTSLSESLQPEAVVILLNEFHSRLAECIFKECGTLDKYLGDGLIAYFGAPVQQEDHALRAVRCAGEMRKALAELNQLRTSRNESEIKFGIGVHSGKAVVGDVGADFRREFTIIGDTVNTASRIESMTKSHQVDLLLSESVVDRLKDKPNIAFVAEELLRGKITPIKLYTCPQS